MDVGDMDGAMRWLWDRVIGKHAKLRKHNEEEATAAAKRDAVEKQDLVEMQLGERH